MHTKFLVAKPKGKRQRGRPRRRWEDNTGMNVREGYGLDSSGSGWDQWRTHVNTVMNLHLLGWVFLD